MRKTKLDESVKAVGRGIFRLLKTESVVEKTIHEQSVRDHTTERFKQILERHRSSKKEHKANAWAIGAEEGRGKLRKASGSRKQAPIRGCPNGETPMESKP